MLMTTNRRPTFRKPSDYKPGKKPEDVVFARLTAEKTRISTSLDCLLNFDLIGKEKRSLVTGEELARATNLVKSKIASGRLDFFDEEGRVITDFQNIMRILYPELAENPYFEDSAGRTFNFPLLLSSRRENSTFHEFKSAQSQLRGRN